MARRMTWHETAAVIRAARIEACDLHDAAQQPGGEREGRGGEQAAQAAAAWQAWREAQIPCGGVAFFHHHAPGRA